MSKSFYIMSKDKILIEFSCEKFSLQIHKVHDENSDIFPFFLRNGVQAEKIGSWMNSRISPIGKRLLKRIVPDERSKGPLGHLGLTLGLSLNDAYWIHDGLHTWDEVNLYENPLNPEIAELAFNFGVDIKQVIGSRSPEFSSSGNMQKCWFKRGNEIFLRKRDEPDSEGVCQTTNEWFAAQAAEAMQLSHVAYDLAYRDSLSPVCECRAFTNIDIGFEPALTFLMARGIDPSFLRFASSSIDFHMVIQEHFGTDFYEDLMVFDSVIGNKDRHMLNFGILYDNNTGKMVRSAPIFDNGLAFDPEEQCCFFPREEQLHYFLRPRHKEMLEAAAGMEFIQHDEVTISEAALEKSQAYVRNFAEKALSWLSSQKNA
ncbi:MAG: hypothetical protein J5846_10975 [Desulfovibrio sp.]|nr:hypothetical protein [Desulfovibrio sp.]